MGFFFWNEEMSVGVKVLDDDHKRMVGLMNELYDVLVGGKSLDEVDRILAELEDYTTYHFQQEEELFGRTDYPDAEIHKREHNELLVWSRKTMEEIRTGTLGKPSPELMNYLQDWFQDHIKDSDKNYASYLKAAGIR